MANQVDILAVGAHPDDAELTAGGTLLRSSSLGQAIGILDLTGGELGSKGSRELRAEEAAKAAEILGLDARENAGIADAHIWNNDKNRVRVVEAIRSLRPSVIILPWKVGRHPDHRVAADLCRDACFLSALKNYPAQGKPFRPDKIVFALAYREDPVKPSFVVDTTEVFETKLEALRCYSSQFDGVQSAGELFPTGQDFYELVRMQDQHTGSLIRKAYGEPFHVDETIEVEDLTRMGVATM